MQSIFTLIASMHSLTVLHSVHVGSDAYVIVFYFFRGSDFIIFFRYECDVIQ